MHIPQTETNRIDILSFDEAVRLSTSDSYDRNTWTYIPDFYTEYRYVLGVKGEKTVICIGVNPSTAEPDNLDPTLKSVSRISVANGYDSWMMFNVYAQRATRPADMDISCNKRLHSENLLAFQSLLKSVSESGDCPVIWAAWGAVIEKRSWLRECVRDFELLSRDYHAQWVCAGKCTRNGHPHHPLYLKKDEPFYQFDIRRYLT